MTDPAFRRIETAGYVATPPSTFGPPVKLQWIAIKDLVIDPEYQRDIGMTGRKNVVRIANAFCWSMFAPVIVAPAGSNRFTIVDGQHRTTAAALCGVDKVPCAIIDATRAGQAAAFAAINTVVTAMSPLQVHAAKLAAGDDKAAQLTEVCTLAGVTICRYPVPANKMKVGETLAAGMLYKLLDKFGAETLGVSLLCITKTRDGYPGLVRAQLIEAFCVVLEAEPAWRDAGPKLLKAVGKLDLAKAFSDARKKTEGSKRAVISELVDLIGEHLDRELGAEAA